MKLFRYYILSISIIPILIALIGENNFFFQLNLSLTILINTFFSLYILLKKPNIYLSKNIRWGISIWLILFFNQIINFKNSSNSNTLSLIFSYLIIFLLLQNYYENKIKINEYIKSYHLFSGIFVFHLIFGLLFYYSRNHNYTSIYYSTNISGFFPNPSYFLNFLLLLSPFIIFPILNIDKKLNSNKFLKFTYILLIISLTVCVFINKSRTGAITLILLILISIFLTRERKLTNLLIVFSVSIISIFSFLKYTAKNDSTNGRLLILKISKEIVVDNPITGIGINNFPKEYSEYQKNYFSKKRNPKEILLADDNKFAHNEFLQTIIELGIISLILIMISIKRLFFHQKNIKKDELTLNEKLKYCFLLVVIIISLFSNPFRIDATQNLIIIISMFFIISSNVDLKYAYIIDKKLILLFISYILVSVLYKQFYLYEWKQYTDKNLYNINSGIFYGDKRIDNNSNYLYYSSKELFFKNDYNNSIIQIKKLLKVDNNSRIQLLLGKNYSKIKESKEAIKCFNNASLMNPRLFEPEYLTMNELLVLKDTIAAKKTALSILKKPIKIPSPKIAYFKKQASKVILQK